MSYLFLDNPISRDFAMVPDALWSWPGLSFKAKGFFAYLLSFRHGVCPPVAAMEAQTGLGRDARKAVMRELATAGLARWVIARDPSGRVLAKRLEVSTRPLLAAILSGADHAPENPSHGGSGVHAPEKPSDGKSVAKRLKTRAAAAENPAIKEKGKEKPGTAVSAAARVQRQPRRLPLESGGAAGASIGGAVARLSDFQRKRLREGSTVQVDGVTVTQGSPAMGAWQAALRAVESGGLRCQPQGSTVALARAVAIAGEGMAHGSAVG